MKPLRMLSVLAFILAGSTLVVVTVLLARGIPFADYGTDYRFYQRLGARALDGDFYLPHQLSGPYSFDVMADSLYPPAVLFLFVPFLVLPTILWWVIPIGITAFVIWQLRPSLTALAVMLALLAWPRAIGAYFFGNTDIWASAAVAAGLRWGWPAVALAMKPTFLPFALIGVRRKSWWVALALGIAVSLIMLPLWLDYLRAAVNLRFQADYSLGSLPILLIPIVALLGRDRSPRVSSPDVFREGDG